jgi:hypothetical protein
MTKKVTQNMNYLNPQGARYLGVFVDVGSFWTNLLLPLREQVSDGHTSSLQAADSTLGGETYFSGLIVFETKAAIRQGSGLFCDASRSLRHSASLAKISITRKPLGTETSTVLLSDND